MITRSEAKVRSKGRSGMMRNPVPSCSVSVNAPKPHKSELPGAANSRPAKTCPTVEQALMVKSAPTKSTLCCNMCACRAWRKEVEASRSLAATL